MEEVKHLDVKIIAALIGIIGIVIASIFSSAGYFFKIRLESKRSARTVLYFLLEIRHTTTRLLFDPNQATEEWFKYFTKKLKDMGINMESARIEEPLFNLVASHFQNINSASKPDIEERILEPFEKALQDLASVNPVLAYRLKGKEKIEAIIDHTKNYQKQYNEVVTSKIEFKPLRNKAFDFADNAKEKALSQIAETLEEDILVLAAYSDST